MDGQWLVVGCILGFVGFVIWLILFLLEGHSWIGLKIMNPKQTMRYIKKRNEKEQQNRNRSRIIK